MDWIRIFDKEFVRDFLKRVFKYSYDGAGKVWKYLKENHKDFQKTDHDQRKWFQLLIGFLFFYLYLAERYAIGHLTEELNDEFIPALEEITIGFAIDIVFEEKDINKRDRINSECQGKYLEFKDYFRRYKKLIPENKQNIKETFFFEFSKMIIKGLVPEEDEFLLKTIQKYLISSLMDIDFHTFIDQVKSVRKAT